MSENPLEDDLNHILEHTRGLWDDLRGHRIFISGGTGFFGHWLLESFLWANTRLNLNASAVVLTRNPAAFIKSSPHLALNPAVSLLQGDVRTFDFPKGQFRFVIHAATDSNPRAGETAPIELVDTIVSGTRHMLEFARQSGTQAFLYTSSGAVYGRQPAEIEHVPEEFAGAPRLGDPRAAYAEGKRMAELMCTLYASEFGLECKIARCFAFVGPYLPLDASFAIGNFIRDEMAGEPIRVGGDGTDIRSYLYASDLAIWLWTILFKGRSCEPCNVGSEQCVSVAETAAAIASAGGNSSVEIEGAQNSRTENGRYVPNTAKARTELGLEERVDLRTAIRKTLNWHASQDGAERRV